jgi:hypothetical protein
MEAREGSAIDEALNIIAAAAAADVNSGPAATSAAAAAHGLEGGGRSEGRDLASISAQPRSDLTSISAQPRSDLAGAQIARADAMAAGPGDGMAAGPGDLTLDAECSVDAGARGIRFREYLSQTSRQAARTPSLLPL